MEKKKKLIILGVILLLIIVSGATFAILTWNSTMIKLGINTNCFTIDYTRGGDITGSLKLLNINELFAPPLEGSDNPQFTIKKGMGLSYVNVGINSNCSIEGYGTIYLNVTELSDTFKDGGESNGALGYAVLKNTSDLSNSDITIDNLDSQSFEVLNIQPIMETGKIELYSEQLSNTEVNKYLVVIFVDKLSAGNDVTEATFKGNISVEAEQVNKYVLTPDYCFDINKNDENKTATIFDYNCYEGNGFGKETITDVVIPEKIGEYKITAIEPNSGIPCSRYGSHCAFYSRKITSVIIPDTVTTIGSSSFASNQLTNIKLGAALTTIGESAFSGNQLTNVIISDSITEIGAGVFSNNPLISIKVDSNNPVYDSRDNSNAIIETSSNTLIQGCKNTIIPNSVTTIGKSAFAANELTSIAIPDSVTTIGWNAFASNQLTSVTIPDSVTTIDGYAFSYNQLTNVILGNSITTIGTSVFEYNQLSSVTISDSVTTIDSNAFANNQLTNVILGNSVTKIGYYAFGYNQLSSVTIPDSVTTIDSNAFRYNNLNYVYIGNDSKLTDISYNAFSSSNSTYTNSNTGITYVDNPNLKTIYYNGSNSLPWICAVNGNSLERNNKFVTGTVPSYTSGTTIYNEVLITTGK